MFLFSNFTSHIDMIQTFGDFIELPASQEYLIIGFSPSSIPLKQRWRNNGLSADFMADYLATFFRATKTTPRQLTDKLKLKAVLATLLTSY
jgi:hypothetical protein